MKLARHSLIAAAAVLTACLIAMELKRIRPDAMVPIASIRASLFYILLDWAIAAGILLCVYSILSLEEIGPLLRASLLASAPAMWLVPAVLLIGTPAPVPIAIGLLLVANTVRVLILRGLSRRDDLRPTQRRRTVRMFSYARGSPAFERESTTVIFGALVFQLGIYTAWAGYGLASAFLVAMGAMAWTLAALSRGVCQPRKRMDSLIGAALTLVLTTAISVRQIGLDTQTVNDPTLPQITYLTFQQLIHTHPLLHEIPAKTVTRVFTPAKALPLTPITLVEGVILRPETIRPKLQFGISRKGLRSSPSPPQWLRFTGEYHLFPASSKGLKKDWSVQAGTPVDSVYATVSGRPLQTEAYQELNPPVDFTTCRTLQLTLVSHEDFPVAVTVQLIGDRQVQDLGPEISGLDRTSEETIDFTVPGSLQGLQVTGIRIIFSCIREECSQSLRIAVQGFRLLPAKL